MVDKEIWLQREQFLLDYTRPGNLVKYHWSSANAQQWESIVIIIKWDLLSSLLGY